MPQIIAVQPRYRWWLSKLAPIAAGLAVIAAIGGYFAWRLIPSASTTVQKAEALDSAGNYAAAEAMLQSAYGRAIFTSDKSMVLSWLAATESDKGDNSDALKNYEKLNKLQPHNEANLEMLGSLADQMGDNSVALSADEQELPLMQSKEPGPTTAAEIQALKLQIAELKK